MIITSPMITDRITLLVRKPIASEKKLVCGSSLGTSTIVCEMTRGVSKTKSNKIITKLFIEEKKKTCFIRFSLYENNY